MSKELKLSQELLSKNWFAVLPPEAVFALSLTPSFALINHSIEMSKASLDCHLQGFHYPSMALARVGLEHAIYAQALALLPGGDKDYLNLVVTKSKKDLRKVRKVIELPTDANAMWDSITSPEEKSLGKWASCTTLLGLFDEADAVKLVYSSLSWTIHPSNQLHLAYEGIESYVGQSGSLPMRPNEQHIERCQSAVLISLMYALSSCDALLQLPELDDRLTKASKLVGLNRRLTVAS